MYKKLLSNSTFLSTLFLIGFFLIIFSEEYFENFIIKYFDGSYLLVAFIIFVFPLSIILGKIFDYFFRTIMANESMRTELIKSSRKSARKRKANRKPFYFGGRCYSCKNWSLEITEKSLNIDLMARECSNCKKISTLEKINHALMPMLFSLLLYRADILTQEQFTLSFYFAILFTFLLVVRHFIILSKPI